MKCPKCGSENVNLIYNTSKRGFKGSDACCGYILLGPLGILCGALGSGKKDTSEFWLCNNCGSRFKNKDIVKYNQNNQKNSYINNQPIEGTYIESEEIEDVQKPALSENDAYNEDLCAPKTVFNRTEPYNGGLSVESLLKRAVLFLEDSEWEKAYEYSENAIDIDARCAEAYLFKFMAEYNISTEDSIPAECACMIEQIDSLTELENYKKAHRFGNDEMKLKLENYSNQAIYNYAAELEMSASFSYEYMNAADVFERISGYSDSSKHIERCKEKYNESEYFHAYEMLLKATSDEEADNAKTAFIMLGDYKDSKEKAESCDEKKFELRYDAACAILDTAQSAANIKNAQSMFKKLGDYKDSAEKAAECDKKCSDFNYSEACKILKNAKTVKKINSAVELFDQVQGYDDISERLEECETKRSEIIETNKKMFKMALICAGVLALIVIIIIIVSSAVNRKDKESAEHVTDIISETESEITTILVTDETKKITSVKTSKITVSEAIEQRLEDVSSEETKSSGMTKLADIVGMGANPYAPTPNIEVDAVLADISQVDYKEIIGDLEYGVGMLEAIHGTDKSIFHNNNKLLGTSDNDGDTLYYYDTGCNTFQELFVNIRICFSESFISNEEIQNVTGGENIFVSFGYSPQQIAWEFYPPNPGDIYDFYNAGVVSYSDTEAEVWVAASSPIEATFEVKVFKMIWYDSYDRWIIDDVHKF